MTQIIDRTGFVPDRFQDLEPVLLAGYADTGALLLGVDNDPSAVVPHFATLKLVVIPFASSADGRGFSLAATLRTLGYRGHLRAQGHVLVDQLRAALRSGFDDVEISDDQAARNPEHQWQAVPHATGYQTHIFARKSAHERANQPA